MVVAHVLGSVLGSGRDTVQVHVLTIEGHPVLTLKRALVDCT